MKRLFTLLAAGILLVMVAGTAMAGSKPPTATVNYSGQGTVNGVIPADRFCDDTLTVNPAVVAGAQSGATLGNYLLWVFTATGAQSATITIFGTPYSMVKISSGTFQFMSQYYDPATLVGQVSATSNVATSNPQLTISHGCLLQQNNGWWCSPGFWATRQSTLAGSPYDPAPFLNDPVPGFPQYTVGYALANPNVVGGTAFNAAGTYIGAQFGFTGTPGVENCPVDAHGNFIG